MIHREVNRTAPAAGLCTGLVRTAGHLWEATEVEVHCVCYGRSCSAFHLRTAHWSTLRSGRFILCVRNRVATRVGLNRAITLRVYDHRPTVEPFHAVTFAEWDATRRASRTPPAEMKNALCNIIAWGGPHVSAGSSYVQGGMAGVAPTRKGPILITFSLCPPLLPSFFFSLHVPARFIM